MEKVQMRICSIWLCVQFAKKFDAIKQLMADENNKMYVMSPAVVNETVRAVLEFLCAGLTEKKRPNIAREVANFLGWKEWSFLRNCCTSAAPPSARHRYFGLRRPTDSQ